MTDQAPDTSPDLYEEARSTVLSAIAAGGARCEMLISEGRGAEAEQVSIAVDQLTQAAHNLAYFGGIEAGVEAAKED